MDVEVEHVQGVGHRNASDRVLFLSMRYESTKRPTTAKQKKKKARREVKRVLVEKIIKKKGKRSRAFCNTVESLIIIRSRDSKCTGWSHLYVTFKMSNLCTGKNTLSITAQAAEEF